MIKNKDKKITLSGLGRTVGGLPATVGNLSTTVGSLSATVSSLSSKVDKMVSAMETGFKKVNEKMDGGFSSVRKEMAEGFDRAEENFNKAEENRESLARMVAGGFENVIGRIDNLERGQENIKLSLGGLAPKFEVTQIEKRVKHLEHKAEIPLPQP